MHEITGAEHVRVDDADLAFYGQDSLQLFKPAPAAIVFPASTDEVQQIVSLANEHQVALVPSGGRTGLSGGATACDGEIVVAFDRMNKILEFDATSRTVRCQAGVITEQLQRFAEDRDLFYPVDFAACGSSQIGGNISTNAGGIKVIRYGMTRNWIVGLTVVTGSGQALHLNKGLTKNNTGYDLRHLFIGAEGTLGLVTEATISLTGKPANSAVMLLGLAGTMDLLPVLQAFQAKIEINAFEYFGEQALEKVIARGGMQRPLDTVTPVYVLVEFETKTEADEDMALAAIEQCMEDGWALDGIISQSRAQAAGLWRLREDISETLSHWSPYKNDLSVIVSKVPEFLHEIDAVIHASYPDFEVISYGHIADGNVHINVLKPEALSLAEFKASCEIVNEKLFSVVESYGGSVSAEHGVGLLKKPYLRYTKSADELALMKQIKQVFDPNGIMNPGKIFD